MLVFCSPTNTNKSESSSDENEISFSNNCLNFDNSEILFNFENTFQNFLFQEKQIEKLNKDPILSLEQIIDYSVLDITHPDI